MDWWESFVKGKPKDPKEEAEQAAWRDARMKPQQDNEKDKQAALDACAEKHAALLGCYQVFVAPHSLTLSIHFCHSVGSFHPFSIPLRLSPLAMSFLSR